MIKAAGHFKQTQNGAYISAGLNVIITIGLVFKFGLVGAAIGTLVAMLYHTCYFVWYLKRNILNRSEVYFIKYAVTDLLVAGLSFWLTRGLSLSVTSYILWVVIAIKVSVIVFAVTALVNVIAYREQVMNVLFLLKRR